MCVFILISNFIIFLRLDYSGSELFITMVVALFDILQGTVLKKDGQFEKYNQIPFLGYYTGWMSLSQPSTCVPHISSRSGIAKIWVPAHVKIAVVNKKNSKA